MDKWRDKVFLGLGSNLGNRKAILKEAVLLIENRIGELVKVSSIYETEAWGGKHLNDFYNQVIEIRTQFNPLDVLEECLEIEKILGRNNRSSENYENRSLDIDLLFYNQFCCENEQLSLPHPFIPQRNFVLVPMQEIAPNFIHPKLALNIGELVAQSEDKMALKRLR